MFFVSHRRNMSGKRISRGHGTVHFLGPKMAATHIPIRLLTLQINVTSCHDLQLLTLQISLDNRHDAWCARQPDLDDGLLFHDLRHGHVDILPRTPHQRGRQLADSFPQGRQLCSQLLLRSRHRRLHARIGITMPEEATTSAVPWARRRVPAHMNTTRVNTLRDHCKNGQNDSLSDKSDLERFVCVVRVCRSRVWCVWCLCMVRVCVVCLRSASACGLCDEIENFNLKFSNVVGVCGLCVVSFLGVASSLSFFWVVTLSPAPPFRWW